MTRKDYQLIADVLRQAYDNPLPDGDREIDGWQDAIDVITNDLKRVLAADNDRFDPVRFIAAALPT